MGVRWASLRFRGWEFGRRGKDEFSPRAALRLPVSACAPCRLGKEQARRDLWVQPGSPARIGTYLVPPRDPGFWAPGVTPPLAIWG